MKASSRSLLVLPLALALACSVPAPTAHAQMVVLDPANLSQQVLHYLNMIKQLTQLQAQLTQLKQQYTSITGIRHMAGIYQEDFVQKMPRDWKETLQGIQGLGKVGSLTKDIFKESSQLEGGNFEHVANDVVEQLKKTMMADSNAQALNSQAFDGSGDRFKRIQDLMQKIDSADDLKAITDLNGRLAGENAMLMNEMIKLQAMNALLENQRRVQAQAGVQSLYQYKRDYMNSDAK